jgi:hypothetical protein
VYQTLKRARNQIAAVEGTIGRDSVYSQPPFHPFVQSVMFRFCLFARKMGIGGGIRTPLRSWCPGILQLE